MARQSEAMVTNQPVIVTCDFCHMSYCLNVANDERQHEKHHQQCINSYKQTLNKYKDIKPTVTWFRPETEDAGVYLALNELNPRLLGFQYSGISEHEWMAIQSGQSKLPVGQGTGDGHDRHGVWKAPDDTIYHYHANWRCGHIHFWKSIAK
jgi:hypothetical protein